MTDWKTMRVPVDAWNDAKDAKREGETWGEFLRRCSEASPTQDAHADTTCQLAHGDGPYEDLQSAVETIEARTGRIEKELDDLRR